MKSKEEVLRNALVQILGMAEHIEASPIKDPKELIREISRIADRALSGDPSE